MGGIVAASVMRAQLRGCGEGDRVSGLGGLGTASLSEMTEIGKVNLLL
jgi:hypothetical protein